MTAHAALVWHELRNRYWIGQCTPMPLADIIAWADTRYGIAEADVMQALGPRTGWRTHGGKLVSCPYLDSKAKDYKARFEGAA